MEKEEALCWRRGYIMLLETLKGWGCIQAGEGEENEVTDEDNSWGGH